MSESSGASNASCRGRYRCDGIPERCWCGNGIVTRMSKSEPNPCRRYFRCELAHGNKMANDNHLFKWVDEALLFEVKKLKIDVDALKEDIQENQKVMEAMYDKVEHAIMEAKIDGANMMKKLVFVCGFGILLMYGITKLV